jgi:hypothetical protein
MMDIYSVSSVIVSKDSAFDYVAFVLAGAGLAAYGLLAKTFIEERKLHILTPSDKLERYVPRWYQRLLLIALGIAAMVAGISKLWR